jgi:hypothetical protein
MPVSSIKILSTITYPFTDQYATASAARVDLLDLKAAFGQAHVERRSRAILAAVLERIAEIAEFILSWFAANR